MPEGLRYLKCKGLLFKKGAQFSLTWGEILNLDVSCRNRGYSNHYNSSVTSQHTPVNRYGNLGLEVILDLIEDAGLRINLFTSGAVETKIIVNSILVL